MKNDAGKGTVKEEEGKRLKKKDDGEEERNKDCQIKAGDEEKAESEKEKTEVRRIDIASRDALVEAEVKHSDRGEKEKKDNKEGKEEKKDKDKSKKRKPSRKEKSKNVDRLKQKLEKINGQIGALMEKRADIMRQLKEAEGESGRSGVSGAPVTSGAATSLPQ